METAMGHIEFRLYATCLGRKGMPGLYRDYDYSVGGVHLSLGLGSRLTCEGCICRLC